MQYTKISLFKYFIKYLNFKNYKNALILYCNSGHIFYKIKNYLRSIIGIKMLLVSTSYLV